MVYSCYPIAGLFDVRQYMNCHILGSLMWGIFVKWRDFVPISQLTATDIGTRGGTRYFRSCSFSYGGSLIVIRSEVYKGTTADLCRLV